MADKNNRIDRNFAEALEEKVFRDAVSAREQKEMEQLEREVEEMDDSFIPPNWEDEVLEKVLKIRAKEIEAEKAAEREAEAKAAPASVVLVNPPRKKRRLTWKVVPLVAVLLVGVFYCTNVTGVKVFFYRMSSDIKNNQIDINTENQTVITPDGRPIDEIYTGLQKEHPDIMFAVPTWLPKGTELVEYSFLEDSKKIFLRFITGETMITLEARNIADNSLLKRPPLDKNEFETKRIFVMNQVGEYTKLEMQGGGISQAVFWNNDRTEYRLKITGEDEMLLYSIVQGIKEYQPPTKSK